MTVRPRPPLNCRVIELTRGHVAIVDAGDYEYLNQWRWWVDRGEGPCLYAVRQERLRGRRFLLSMHQLIVGDVPSGMRIHHRNRWGLDNRRCNLVLAPPGWSSATRGPDKRSKTSRFKGVHLCYKTLAGEIRWGANITIDGRHTYLGVYEDEIQAAESHDLEAVRHYGRNAWVNFPEKMGKYLYMVKATPSELSAQEAADEFDEYLDD